MFRPMTDKDIEELAQSLGKSISSLFSWVCFSYRRLVSWVWFS